MRDAPWAASAMPRMAQRPSDLAEKPIMIRLVLWWKVSQLSSSEDWCRYHIEGILFMYQQPTEVPRISVPKFILRLSCRAELADYHSASAGPLTL